MVNSCSQAQRLLYSLKLIKLKQVVELTLFYCIFNHKHNYTADDGYGEKSETEPCCDDAECKGNDSCDGGGCCLCYCWESHYGKGDVGHIIEETAEKRVPYLSADK